MKLIADTYENSSLVVRHVFFGETLDDAESILDAHLETDAFLDASMEKEISENQYQGEWEGIPLKTVLYHSP